MKIKEKEVNRCVVKETLKLRSTYLMRMDSYTWLGDSVQSPALASYVHQLNCLVKSVEETDRKKKDIENENNRKDVQAFLCIIYLMIIMG